MLSAVLPDALYLLLAREALGQATAQDYLDWACGLLEAGSDSHALLRLAACSATDDLTFEIKPWFAQTLQELGLTPPPLSPDFWLDTAEVLIQQALAGQLAPELLLAHLVEVDARLPASVWLLRGFVDLNEALEMLQHAETRAYAQAIYADLSAGQPLSACLLGECQLFLALRPLQPPAELWRQVYCQHCGQRDLPGQRPLPLTLAQKLQYQLQNRPRPYESVCRHCSQQELLWLQTLAGRRWWLAQHGAC
jgi:hypothetical protein